MNPTSSPLILRLPPSTNSFVVGIAEAQVVSADDLPRITDQLAEIGSGERLPPELASWLEPQIKIAVELANSQYFKFDLRFLFEDGQPVLGEVGSESISLPSLDAENSTRKLTVFLPFGTTASPIARIVFPTLDGKSRDLVPGQVYMFPSFLAHEISPEYPFTALIGHALGNAFK